MSWRNLTVFLILILTAAISIQFARQQKPEITRTQTNDWPGGYYMKKARLWGTGQDGRTLYRLDAEQAVQNANEKGLLLETVSIDYTPDSGPSWLLQSRHGRILQSEERIELWGDVTVIRSPEIDSLLLMRTDSLDIDASTHIATTDAPVRITMSGQIVDSVGMQAFLNEDKLKLQSRVHGTFKP